MKKKILNFLFPKATIVLTSIFFALAWIYNDLQTAIPYALIFFFYFMIPLDVIICIANIILKLIHNNRKVVSEEKPNGGQQTQEKPIFRTSKFQSDNRYTKGIEYFANFCTAGYELDKDKNYSYNATGGNIRYNDKRFDNIANDPDMVKMISNDKINAISSQIVKIYMQKNIRIFIERTNCTKAYLVLKVIPVGVTSLNDITLFQNDIGYQTGMPTLIDVFDNRGYAYIIFSIQNFIDDRFRDVKLI